MCEMSAIVGSLFRPISLEVGDWCGKNFKPQICLFINGEKRVEKKSFLQFIVIYTVKGFGIVNKLEIDVSLEFSCFFDDPKDVGNLISGSSPFSKSSLNTGKFTVHVLLKLGWKILSITLLVCVMSAIVW